MFPIIGGLLGSIGSTIGGIFNNEQNNKNSQEMQLQAEMYNTQMSNTAYQRASADMKAAGLNPMMMFGSGSAASSPTIAPAQKTSAAGKVGDSIKDAISSAVALKTADSTIDNLIQQNANLKANEALTAADEAVRHVDWNKRNQEYLTERERTKEGRSRATIAANLATTAANEQDMDPTVRKGLDQLGYGGRKADNIISPISNLVGTAKVAKMLRPQRSTTETTRDDGTSSFSERWSY